MNTKFKLESYNDGYNWANEQLVIVGLRDNHASLVKIADTGTLASDAYYAGMLAALFPCKAYYHLAEW